ncbi:hypothetical protein H4R19_006750 [Coemansia spiralis]|nr:hypothetical protein H4R19_006750 [Coemansia spiralis]
MVRPADGSSTIEIADDATSLSSGSALAATDRLPDTVTQLEVQQRMDDIHVAAKCSALGIDSNLVRNWDPAGLHRSATYTQLADAETAADLESATSTLSDSESEYDDVDTHQPSHQPSQPA